MTNKQNPKAKDALSKTPDYKDILAITEGRFGKPVKKSGGFINANYPPDNVSQEELRRFWGEPREEDRNLLDKVKVKEKRRNKPSFL